MTPSLYDKLLERLTSDEAISDAAISDGVTDLADAAPLPSGTDEEHTPLQPSTRRLAL